MRWIGLLLLLSACPGDSDTDSDISDDTSQDTSQDTSTDTSVDTSDDTSVDTSDAALPADVAEALDEVMVVELDDLGTEQCGYRAVLQGIRRTSAGIELIDGLLPAPQTYDCEQAADSITCDAVTREYNDGFLDHTSASTPSANYNVDTGTLTVSVALDESFVGANGEGISGSCRQTLSGAFVF